MKFKRLSFLFAFLLIVGLSQMNAQYKTGAGLAVDFGDGSTFVGPHLKHFFTANHAGNFEVGFADGVTAITALYQYHKGFSGAAGLQWFIGGGASALIGDGDSSFALRPDIGLDYKINGAPLALSFDWRPAFLLEDTNGNSFEAGRFGLGIRYTFN